MAFKLDGYNFWKSALKSAKLIVAPMVDQSELAWRLLSRTYGAQLCYTPMFHASSFRRDPIYRRDNFKTCPADRPLIVQFCANDPVTLLEAARFVERQCDAVDINLGCPQIIAKRGHYGAFLQDEWDLVSQMVTLLHRELAVPVTCKIRVFDDINRTIEYAKMLERSGCQLLTVHGRTREQKGPLTGLASWKHIKAVKDNVNIPVFANGNIQCLRDIETCFIETGVDGIMSAEGNLYNPSIFIGKQPPCWEMVDEYLKLVEIYPAHISFVRGHLFKLWLHVLQNEEYQCFREQLGMVKTLENIQIVSNEIKSKLLANLTKEEIEADYDINNLPFWRCHSYVRPSPGKSLLKRGDADAVALKRRKRKQERMMLRSIKPKGLVDWSPCGSCKCNPKAEKCINDCCKICCKLICHTRTLDCAGHRFLFKTRTSMGTVPLVENQESGNMR